MITHTNKAKLPNIIQRWLEHDDYDGYTNRAETYSTTSLLKSHKKALLDKVALTSPDYSREIDVQQLAASRKGTALHDSIEKYANSVNIEGVIVEQRHKREIIVDGIPAIVSGKFDCIEDNVIMDWKETRIFSHLDMKKHADYKLQLSINRWACRPALGELEPHGVIVAFYKDFSQAIADKQAPFNYPEFGTQPYTYELLSYEETEAYLIERIRERRLLKSVEDANEVTCTPEDLWTANGQYKYFSKPENTRATKVSNNLAELQALVRAKGGIIIEPAPRACEYCHGRELCEQYQGFVARGLFNATGSL